MAIEGVDFANERPNAAALVRAGKEFVVRYLSPNTNNNPRKQLTAAEVAAYRAADLSICVVWETGTSRARAGRAAGQADATSAAAVAHSLGFPSGQPIYFAIDEDTTGAAVDPYFRGCADRIGVARVGAYGGIKPISYLFDHQLIRFGWQTFAWSSGRWDPRAQAQQYRNDVTVAGVTVDLDRAMTGNYGQWEALDMATVDLTPAAIAAVRNAILAAPIFARPANEQSDTGLSLAWAARGAYFRSGYVANTAVPAIEAALAQLTGTAVSQAAMQATLDTMNSSGGSVDTATLAAQIQEVGDRQSASLVALQQRISAIGPAVAAAIMAALPATAAEALTADQVEAIVNSAIEQTGSQPGDATAGGVHPI